MPSYDYECPNGHRFELFRQMSERDEPAKCPACIEMATKRLPTAPSRYYINGDNGASATPKGQGKP